MALFKGKGGNPPNMIKTKDFTMLRFVVLSSCAIFACGFLLKYRSSTSQCYLRRRSLYGRTPLSKGELFRTQSKDILQNILLTSSILASLLPIKQAKAMGTLFQYKNQPVIFQDVSFNVIDTQKAADFYLATFPNLCRILRTTRSNNNVNTTVLAFGPDAYASPKNFLPGISSFYADGGHATLTLRSEQFNDDTVAIYESGDAIQSIKIGVDNFRVSKAIEKGLSLLNSSSFFYISA